MTIAYFPGILKIMRWLTDIRVRGIFPLVIIVLLCVLPYVSTLANGFVWDDEQFVLGWNHPATNRHVISLLLGELPEGHSGVYRPVRSLFFLLSYKLFETAPLPYHVQSMIVHILAIVLVYGITRHLTQRPLIPILTALVFGMHPIHTEAITFVTAGFDTAGIVIGLGALWCFSHSLNTRNTTLYILSVFLTCIAIFTNEICLAIPFLMTIIYFYLGTRTRTTGTIGKLAVCFFPIAAYFFVRFSLLHIPIRSDIFPTLTTTALTMTKVLAWYTGRLFFPLQLSVTPVLFPGVTSLTSDPTALAQQRWTDPGTLAGLIILMAGIVTAVVAWKKSRLIGFGLAWFFLSLLPVSNIFPSGTIFAERYLYLPSIGFALVMAAGTEWGIRKRTFRTATLAILLVFLLSALALTQLRNLDWRSPVSLWEKTVKQVPDHPLVWNNLGLAYAQKAEFGKAVPVFEKTIQLNPNEAKAYYNLGLVYAAQKDFTTAVPLISKAINLRPDIGSYHYKLVEMYTITGNFSEALTTLKAAPVSPNAELQYYGLAMIMLRANKLDLALRTFKYVVELNPKNVQALNNLGALYNATEQYAEAVSVLEQGLTLTPDDYTLRVNLGTAYEELGQTEKSIDMYEAAREINPFSKEIEKKLQHVYKEATASGKIIP